MHLGIRCRIRPVDVKIRRVTVGMARAFVMFVVPGIRRADRNVPRLESIIIHDIPPLECIIEIKMQEISERKHVELGA